MDFILRKLKLLMLELSSYKWLVKNVIPFIRFTTYYTGFKGWKYKRGYSKLRDCDIILSVDKQKLSAFLVPGDWSHATLCVNTGAPFWELSEMTRNDYEKSTFFDICSQSTRVAIYRINATEEEKREIIEKCKSLQYTKYDYKFELGIKALSCAELIYMSDEKKTIGASLEDVAGLGRPYITPDGLAKARNVELIWDSKDAKR